MTVTHAFEILVLWHESTHVASTVHNHVHALKKHSHHSIRLVSMLGEIPPEMDLDRFDGIIIHYSLVASQDNYLSPTARNRLTSFAGVKGIFLQDEYRFVNQTIDAMREIGVHLLFTCVPEDEIGKVYSEKTLPGVNKVNVLTGYVDEAVLNFSTPDYDQRPIDICYRARKLPAWLGTLGQEKWNIGQRVTRDALAYDLKIDVAYREEERIYGVEWLKFMSSSKSTLGVESGASVFDFTGEIQSAVDAAVGKNPARSFDDLKQQYFFHMEGKIRLNQISPRCFEAAALKTLMILYQGDYSGRLTPWRHYVPLNKDHSNFKEVVAVIKNTQHASKIIDCAYQEVALNPANHFRAMAMIFDNALDLQFNQVGFRRVLAAFTDSELDLAIASKSAGARLRQFKYKAFMKAYFLIFGDLLGWLTESKRDWVHRNLRHALKCITNLFRRS